jgi:regulator of sigma D
LFLQPEGKRVKTFCQHLLRGVSRFRFSIHRLIIKSVMLRQPLYDGLGS